MWQRCKAFGRCQSAVHLLTQKCVQLASFRYLNMTETTTALRPFYFAVHPDLFGQYPKQRAVNEESLKLFNEYINLLYAESSSGRPQPKRLTFWIKDKGHSQGQTGLMGIVSDNTSLREVSIKLMSTSPRETVKTVLDACRLPLDYLDKTKSAPTQAPVRPGREVRWQDSYEAHFGKKPWEEKEKSEPRVHMDTPLTKWLENKISSAHDCYQSIAPIRNVVNDIKTQIQDEYDIEDIHWRSSYGVLQYRACLLRFSNLLESYPEIVDVLQGRVIVFHGSGPGFDGGYGLNIHGEVLLRANDVQELWLETLSHIAHSFSLLRQISNTENQLSRLLNNVTLNRDEAKNFHQYSSQLADLLRSIKAFLASNPEADKFLGSDQDFSGVKLSPSPTWWKRPALSEKGCILVPMNCKPDKLLLFLQRYAENAREMDNDAKRMKDYDAEFREEVRCKLGLRSLSIDDNIERSMVNSCCQRLLDKAENYVDLTKDVELKVSRFYSVMADGEVCIPWNWHDR